MTTKTLRLTFVNSKDKKTSINVPQAAQDLSEAEVRDAMNIIAASNIFNREGVDLYTKAQSAQYVERNVTAVFDDSKAE